MPPKRLSEDQIQYRESILKGKSSKYKMLKAERVYNHHNPDVKYILNRLKYIKNGVQTIDRYCTGQTKRENLQTALEGIIKLTQEIQAYEQVPSR